MTLTQTESAPVGRLASGGIHRVLVVYSTLRSEVGYSRGVSHEPFVIGRDPGPQPCLQIRHAQVSRRHARIEPLEADEGWLLRDLGSRNGTFVNGRRADAVELRDGDVIRVGSSLLLFQYLDMAACELVLDPGPPAGRLVGRGHAMARVRTAMRAAPTTAPTLIVGETGVGKELVAQGIHEGSGRPGPFVAVNCSALPSDLVESELFGHVRGAFTGASGRLGLFGRADGGTLFLDEIGEIGLDVQAKLLRALAIGEVRPVGADDARIVDVRVVVATNVDLEAAVSRGTFRADLYARLMSHIIVVPPLRSRREDILELTHHFLASAGEFEITPDAAEAMLTYGWPYNVRELEQVLAPLAAPIAQRGTLDFHDLPVRLHRGLEQRFHSTAQTDTSLMALIGVRRSAVPNAEELRTVVSAYQGNIAQGAAFFGKDRRQIYRWAQALDVDIASLRDAIESRSPTLPPPFSPPDTGEP